MSPINHKLSHLTEKQIQNLIDQYYQGKSATKLIEEYQINASPSEFVRILPNIIHQDLFCSYCKNINMETKRVSKSSLKWESMQKPFCPICNHNLDANCYCKNCKHKRESISATEENMKREAIQKATSNQRVCTVEVEEITPKEALILLSIVRHSLSDDLCFAAPFTAIPVPLTPSYDLTFELTNLLYGRGFLSLSPTSNTDAFTFDEEITEAKQYTPAKVIWEFLPGMDLEEKKNYIQNLEEIAEDEDWAYFWEDEIPTLWRMINKYEAIEYFLYQLDDRGFNPKIGDKTHAVFENLLNHYSIGQIFNLIWQSAKDVIDYAHRNNTPKYVVANLFINFLQNRSDRSIANKWQIKASRRDFKCPQSTISSTFFNKILKIGDNAFERKPPELLKNE